MTYTAPLEFVSTSNTAVPPPNAVYILFVFGARYLKYSGAIYDLMKSVEIPSTRY